LYKLLALFMALQCLIVAGLGAQCGKLSGIAHFLQARSKGGHLSHVASDGAFDEICQERCFPAFAGGLRAGMALAMSARTSVCRPDHRFGCTALSRLCAITKSISGVTSRRESAWFAMEVAADAR
jgi:hypothetical protein